MLKAREVAGPQSLLANYTLLREIKAGFLSCQPSVGHLPRKRDVSCDIRRTSSLQEILTKGGGFGKITRHVIWRVVCIGIVVNFLRLPRAQPLGSQADVTSG